MRVLRRWNHRHETPTTKRAHCRALGYRTIHDGCRQRRQSPHVEEPIRGEDPVIRQHELQNEHDKRTDVEERQKREPSNLATTELPPRAEDFDQQQAHHRGRHCCGIDRRVHEKDIENGVAPDAAEPVAMRVRKEKQEQRQQHVASDDHAVLVEHEEREWEEGSHATWKRRAEDHNRDGGGGDRDPDCTHAPVGQQLAWDIQNQVPEAGMPLVSESFPDQLQQARVSTEKPGLRLVRPRLVMPRGRREQDARKEDIRGAEDAGVEDTGHWRRRDRPKRQTPRRAAIARQRVSAQWEQPFHGCAIRANPPPRTDHRTAHSIAPCVPARRPGSTL